MSTTYAGPLERLNGALDEFAAISPEFRRPARSSSSSSACRRAVARPEAELLRVLAAADDIAEATGDRSTAAWLADADPRRPGRRPPPRRLAAALDQRWTQVAAAFAAGQVNLAQTRVITEALAALPEDLGEDLLAKAETLLVTRPPARPPRAEGASDPGPGVPGPRHRRRGRVPAAARRRAPRPGRDQALFRPRGDGSTDLNARVPDHVANRLRTYLDGYTSPRNNTGVWARSTSCPCPRAAARRSARSWRTCPPPACPAKAAPPPPSPSPSTGRPSSPTSAPPASP